MFTENQKMAILNSCEKEYFKSNGLGKLDDELFDILNSLKEDYKNDKSFNSLIKNNKHFFR